MHIEAASFRSPSKIPGLTIAKVLTNGIKSAMPGLGAHSDHKTSYSPKDPQSRTSLVHLHRKVL